MIGSPPYNRVVWSAAPAEYAAFARRAVADADGPLLDAGCGTLVFSADAYRRASRRLVLGALAALAGRLAPGGRLFASSLVAATPIGRRMLKLLQRAGEVAPPRSEEDFAAALRARFDGVEVERRGSMAYATARSREAESARVAP